MPFTRMMFFFLQIILSKSLFDNWKSSLKGLQQNYFTNYLTDITLCVAHKIEWFRSRTYQTISMRINIRESQNDSNIKWIYEIIKL